LYKPCNTYTNKKPLRRLDFGSNVYVLDKELQQIQLSGSYILIPTLNDVGRIISETSVKNQISLSVTPCQTEITKPIYKIYILDDKKPSETLLYKVGDKVRYLYNNSILYALKGDKEAVRQLNVKMANRLKILRLAIMKIKPHFNLKEIICKFCFNISTIKM
jgi:hypothetical protein